MHTITVKSRATGSVVLTAYSTDTYIANDIYAKAMAVYPVSEYTMDYETEGRTNTSEYKIAA